jgi:hypothetical protein
MWSDGKNTENWSATEEQFGEIEVSQVVSPIAGADSEPFFL